MRSFLFSALWATVVLAVPVNASMWDLCSCGRMEVGAEFLYLKPYSGFDSYLVSDPRPYVPINNQGPQINTDQVAPQGTIRSARIEYRPGFRVYAGWLTSDGCMDATARYTWLHTTTRKRIAPSPETGGIWATLPNLSETTLNVNLVSPANPRVPYVQVLLFNPIAAAGFPNQIPAFARSSKHWNYDAADLEFASRNMMGCRLWTRSFAAIHFANVFTKHCVHYEGTLHPGTPIENNLTFNLLPASLISDHRRSTNSWALGPRVGGEAAYSIGCGFQVTGKAALGLLAGQTKLTYQDILTWNVADSGSAPISFRIGDVHTPASPILVPEIDMRLGIGYLLSCWGCTMMQLDVGYEFITYLNMLNFGPTYREDRAILDLPNRAFNLDGLSVRAMFIF